MTEHQFIESAEALVGHDVKVQIEDPRRRGMALYHQGVIQSVSRLGVVLDSGRAFTFDMIYSIEIRNPAFKLLGAE